MVGGGEDRAQVVRRPKCLARAAARSAAREELQGSGAVDRASITFSFLLQVGAFKNEGRIEKPKGNGGGMSMF
jgi:cell division protein FtsN